MDFYITKFAQESLAIENKKFITIHYYKNCRSLNSDYIHKDLVFSNSGVKTIKFCSVSYLLNFLKENQCKSSICTKCQQMEGANSFDQYLKEAKEGNQIISDFLKEYDELKFP